MPADRVRRAVPPVVAWVAAAVVAVAVASWGVALVGRSVTDDRPAPLQAAQIEQRLAEASNTTSSTAPTMTTTAPGSPTSVDTLPTTPASTPGPGPTPTTTRPAAPSATAPPPAPTTTTPGETRTYVLVGGTASLRFSPSGVTVVFANPAQGFDVDIEPEHGNGVRVRFESESHESRLVGWWQEGPRAETEERADD